MKKTIVFQDPYFTGSKTSETNGLIVTYPNAEPENISYCLESVRHFSAKFFANHSSEEISDKIDRLDNYFCDLKSPEIIKLIDLTEKTSGFSRHDIEKFGLGIYPLLVNYDKKLRAEFITRAMKSNRIIETFHGYLKRFGWISPFIKWQEPTLISHFISGNVVGYTSVLSRIGFPIKVGGAGQILKLPSSSAFSPMIYLDKLGQMEPDLRKTIACAYWPGGDNDIEKIIIEKSDAINILSSDAAISDLERRMNLYNPKIKKLLHGHKIGIAYVSQEFIEDPTRLDQVLSGLACDISAFDGGACYNVKNIFVQGNARKFAENLHARLDDFAKSVSPVSQQAKPIGNDLYNVYLGSKDVITSETRNAFVRIKQKAEFWTPDTLHRYVQVMSVKDEKHVSAILSKNTRYLQTAIVAIEDDKLLDILDLFGRAGISNIHYPGSAPLINVYEEPHDGEFDFIKIRFNYSAKFAATNFKKNSDWLIN